MRGWIDGLLESTGKSGALLMRKWHVLWRAMRVTRCIAGSSNTCLLLTHHRSTCRAFLAFVTINGRTGILHSVPPSLSRFSITDPHQLDHVAIWAPTHRRWLCVYNRLISLLGPRHKSTSRRLRMLCLQIGRSNPQNGGPAIFTMNWSQIWSRWQLVT